MKRIVPLEKFRANPEELLKNLERTDIILVPTYLYETIQKNKKKKLAGRPRGVSHSFCKLFILAQLMGEKLSFEQLQKILEEELGYRQKRGLYRHLSELIRLGLVRKVDGEYMIPEVNAEYVGKVERNLVYNEKSYVEFESIFLRALPKEVRAQWIVEMGEELRKSPEAGDRKTLEWWFEMQMNMLKGFLLDLYLWGKMKTTEEDPLLVKARTLERMKNVLEKLANDPKTPRRIRYKAEVMLDILNTLAFALRLKRFTKERKVVVEEI